eukprot:TRINITY_DN3412_c0_g1_i1.p1 TRINITY_DN3412_c0_g1~~TRINITY_DN3412_c0_g1_i1.p1  ORF type:complete len:282 (+),score=109.95 TRINITY_DN3412_c0_g1_i1:35-847(+)
MYGESQPLLNNGGGGYNNYNNPTSGPNLDAITKNISALLTELNQLNTGIKKIGTASDNPSLRSSLRTRQQQTIQTMKTTGEQLKQIGAANSNLTGDSRAKYQKLLSTFQHLAQQFQTVNEDYSRKIQSFAVADAPEQSSYGGMVPQGNATNDPWGQLDFKEIDSTEHDSALIQERNQGIRQVTEDLMVMHEIFSDVAKMVGDQGQQLNYVEDTMVNIGDTVEQAVYELEDARELQKKARNKKIMIVIIIVVFLVVIITGFTLFLYFFIKK